MQDGRPVILRPYQEQMAQAWFAFLDRGLQRGLIVSATGTGKTTLIWKILEEHARADSGFAALTVAHRRELLEQIYQRGLHQVPWLKAGIECGDQTCPRDARVAVASVQSIGQPGSTRLNWLGPGLVVCDEGHHGAAKTYQNTFRRFGCYDESGTPLLGVTATPHRLDQLALYGSERAIFQEIVFQYDIVRAIKDGFLVDLKGFRAAADFDLKRVKKQGGDYVASSLEKVVNVEPVTELAYKSWSEVAADRQTIVYCAGVDHAKDVANLFCEHGVKAEAVWGDMPKPLREAVIQRFRKGETQVLTNMDILTEGFDSHACSCVLLLRPTQSWSLFTQMVGRGLRVLPHVIEGIGDPVLRRSAISQSEKPDCYVIDIVSNTDVHSVNAKPDDGNQPSLQGLVGLPSTLDLEGRSLAKAVEDFEMLPEVLKAAAFRRPTSFSGLSAHLTQVEMLRELDIPEEAKEADAKLYWLKVGDMHYVLDCGTSLGAGNPITRKAVLVGDYVGNWTLSLESWMDNGMQLRNEQHRLSEAINISEVFKMAEDRIRRHFPGVSRTAAANAVWRKGEPTLEQVIALRSYGIAEDVISEMTKGEASAMLTALREQRRHD